VCTLTKYFTQTGVSKLLVTGEFIGAGEAKARGLVNRVAEPEQLDSELEKLVAAILSKPRVAVAMGKEFFYRQAELSIAAAYKAASSNNGLQHDGRSCARRRAGVHRKTTAALEMIEAHAIWKRTRLRVLLSASRRNNLLVMCSAQGRNGGFSAVMTFTLQELATLSGAE